MTTPIVSYGLFTCAKQLSLANTSLATCLLEQPVDVLSDVDDRDVALKMHSLGTKLLRWLTGPVDSLWTLLVDDDTWVNASVVQHVCEQLDPDLPTIAGYGCVRTPLDNGGYGDVFGQAALLKAQRWWDTVTKVSGFTSFWHAGAGMLVNRAMVRELRTVAFDGTSKLSESVGTTLERRGSAQQQVLSAITQDKLMSVLVNMVRAKGIEVKQRRLRGTSLWYPDGTLRREPAINAWERIGNGIGALGNDKFVCDLNCSYPKLANGKFNPTLAASLVTANANPRASLTQQHVIPGQANLMTWHRFKQPEMFHQLQAEMRAQYSLGNSTQVELRSASVMTQMRSPSTS